MLFCNINISSKAASECIIGLDIGKVDIDSSLIRTVKAELRWVMEITVLRCGFLCNKIK